MPRHALHGQRHAHAARAGRFSRARHGRRVAGNSDCRYALARRSRDGRAARGLPSCRQAGRSAARQAHPCHRLRSDRRADGGGGALRRCCGNRRDRYRRRAACGRPKTRREPYRQQRDGNIRARSLSRGQGRVRCPVRGFRQPGGAAFRARSLAPRGHHRAARARRRNDAAGEHDRDKRTAIARDVPLRSGIRACTALDGRRPDQHKTTDHRIAAVRIRGRGL